MDTFVCDDIFTEVTSKRVLVLFAITRIVYDEGSLPHTSWPIIRMTAEIIVREGWGAVATTIYRAGIVIAALLLKRLSWAI